MCKKIHILLTAALLSLSLLLSACSDPTGTNNTPSGGQEPTQDPDSAFTLTAAVADAQSTLDPAAATAEGSATVLHHLYENLMKWEDDGSGIAQLAPGQAESYTVVTDYAGNATYTFTLREGIQWSDGQPVTAGDFVAAWQRLADPANDLPHRKMLQMVSGYDQPVPEDWAEAEPPAWDPAKLSVSAPDDRTFVVTLVGSCAYFLEEVCASAYTMPVRTDLVGQKAWTDGTVTNGAYTASARTAAQTTLVKSGTYYAANPKGPETLTFVPSAGASDYEKLLSGELDLVTHLPGDTLQALADSGSWLPEPVTATYGVVLNTQRPPFDDPDVRLAFRLAIDNQALVSALGDLTVRPASGIVPYGISDYGEHALRQEPAADTQSAIPDANSPTEPAAPTVPWDFRQHSLEKVTVPENADYAANCQKAQALLAQAGYAGGGGFPVVEYIYVESDVDRTIAQELQRMWKEQLGITVAIRGLSQEEYDAMLAPAQGSDESGDTPQAPTGEFFLAGQPFTGSYNDAAAFLHPWHSQSHLNWAGYFSDAFDILLNSAEAAVSADARDAYLHDAEAILLMDAPVIPLCYQGGSSALADGLTGLYCGPNGLYFLSGITAST